MCRCVFDLPALEAELGALQRSATAPAFWDDPERARDLMQRLARLERQTGTWRGLEHELHDLREMLALAAAEEEPEAVLADVAAEVGALEARFAELEVELTLSGPYDDHHALLSLHAGAGGVEAQDWAEMLLRMYLRWAERHRMQTEILDISSGDEAGIKSAEVRIAGETAYGLLRSERGVHRLVRISPFDSSHSRHTSFALVEVLPEAREGEVSVEIRPEDIRVDTFKAGGHGGQNVQKNDTAVRITHLPTGIVAQCQNERSQGRNREGAMRVLQSRLLELEIEKRERERAKLRGEHVEPGWGNQIRSYVLQPYRMVKDLRTDEETSDTDAVLDGDIDRFVQAYLRSRVGEDDDADGSQDATPADA